jgi:pseudouridine-5'-phosphate glycosidase
MNHAFLNINQEVSTALKNGDPIVALESTIISHGMPWPQNMETALAVEDEVRKSGAVPATIAILDGKLQVGLAQAQIALFAQQSSVWKVSLRDMPYVVSQKLPGGTTVAATMRIAAMAGIQIFATGGTGGVHRGATTTMDISADLPELSRTNVAVVSAGVKSILDIGLTLEFLETAGVPVITIGQDIFPSFYTKYSDYASPLRLDLPEDIAHLLDVKWKMGLNGSVLIANPLNAEKSMDPKLMDRIIEEALNEAEKNKIIGKSVTPFLLKYIADRTEGESLDANIALIKSNASVAAAISIALSKLKA